MCTKSNISNLHITGNSSSVRATNLSPSRNNKNNNSKNSNGRNSSSIGSDNNKNKKDTKDSLPPTVFAGGDLSVHGFDKAGNETYWTVTGGNIGAMTLLDINGDGLNELIGLNSINLDNPPPNISSYRSGTKVNINFGEGGIVVLNSQSVKGLEFDVVFIADINEFRIRNNDLDAIKKSFYVMISRAIRQVILLKRKGATCDVDSILPIDQGLLKVL